MARPVKNNADYFPHDAHMRNDPRILALRRKFGLNGYAVYVMTIEAMTNASHFKLDVSITGREIISGDFGIDLDSLDSILRYCTQIDLFQLKNDELTCKSLTKRFDSLIKRRVSDAETIQKPTETTQEPYSKVKESKGKESKGEDSKADQKADQSLYAEVNAFLQRKNPNTMDVAFMVRQWQDQGVKDIMSRLKAMKAFYTANDWKFPTKIETLTQSLLDADWTEKLKELNPERKAETVANLKYIPKPAEHDTIGTSAPGSLG